MIKKTLAVLAFSILLQAQAPRGLSPCTGNPPTAISVSNVSSNTILSTCGGTLLLMNIGTVEAFWDIGTASTTAASTSSKSIPGGTYLVLNVPTGTAYYLAAITAASTTTIRLIQGIGN